MVTIKIEKQSFCVFLFKLYLKKTYKMKINEKIIHVPTCYLYLLNLVMDKEEWLRIKYVNSVNIDWDDNIEKRFRVFESEKIWNNEAMQNYNFLDKYFYSLMIENLKYERAIERFTIIFYKFFMFLLENMYYDIGKELIIESKLFKEIPISLIKKDRCIIYFKYLEKKFDKILDKEQEKYYKKQIAKYFGFNGNNFSISYNLLVRLENILDKLFYTEFKHDYNIFSGAFDGHDKLDNRKKIVTVGSYCTLRACRALINNDKCCDYELYIFGGEFQFYDYHMKKYTSLYDTLCDKKIRFMCYYTDSDRSKYFYENNKFKFLDISYYAPLFYDMDGHNYCPYTYVIFHMILRNIEIEHRRVSLKKIIWTKNKHKFIKNNKKKNIIKTFIMCIKILKISLPHLVLSEIFSSIINI